MPANLINTTFDPGRVMFGKSGNGPYLPTAPQSTGNINTLNPVLQVPKSPVLAPEAVRATGSGPYDAAYRQNLATYAGGQFERPNGNLSFNPTDMRTFPGNPTGGGNAPLPGLPNSLISNALGGSPFSVAQPQSATTSTSTSSGNISPVPNWQEWLQRFRNQGRMFGLME